MKELKFGNATIDEWIKWIDNELEPPITASPEDIYIIKSFKEALIYIKNNNNNILNNYMEEKMLIKFKLYDETGKEATQEEYSDLFLTNNGELLQYYDDQELHDIPQKKWKIVFYKKTHARGK